MVPLHRRTVFYLRRMIAAAVSSSHGGWPLFWQLVCLFHQSLVRRESTPYVLIAE